MWTHHTPSEKNNTNRTLLPSAVNHSGWMTFFLLPQPWGILFVPRYCQTSPWEKRPVEEWRWHVRTLAGYQRLCSVMHSHRARQERVEYVFIITRTPAWGGRCFQPAVKHNAHRRPHAQQQLEVEDTTLTHPASIWATAQNAPPSYFKQSVNMRNLASSAVDEWWETALLRKLIFF